MTERETQLRALYRAHRLDHQQRYYRDTADEYDAAAGQASRITTNLMAIAALAAAASAVRLLGWSGWSIVAAAVPALVTALATYEGLYGFERNAKLYDDAATVLAAAQGRVAAGEEPLAASVGRAEAAMRREQSQWGQLSLDAEPPR
jgi:conflict system pore-forming effector with SLATT domain